MNYLDPQPQPQMVRPTYPNTAPYNNRIRPVSSLEEVRASAIDFDGSVFYFPDAANKTIYTKQINLDGTALVNKLTTRLRACVMNYSLLSCSLVICLRQPLLSIPCVHSLHLHILPIVHIQRFTHL